MLKNRGREATLWEINSVFNATLVDYPAYKQYHMLRHCSNLLKSPANSGLSYTNADFTHLWHLLSVIPGTLQEMHHTV